MYMREERIACLNIPTVPGARSNSFSCTVVLIKVTKALIQNFIGKRLLPQYGTTFYDP